MKTTFRQNTETLLYQIEHECDVHTKDVKYSSGYSIFEMGEDSVVHFKIGECEGWLFGIWWRKDDNNRLEYDFFAQYESTIDKFKPAASMLKCRVSGSSDIGLDVCDIVNFIKNEPYLAFCRDYCYWDYNREYHSREEAKKEFDDYDKKHSK